MTTKLKETDVVIIGVGMVGSIMAKELAAAGYKVVGLERGRPRFTVPDFQGPSIHDELRFDIRKALMQDNTREARHFTNTIAETALPIRRWGPFAGDWSRRLARALEWPDLPLWRQRFPTRLQSSERYGANFLDRTCEFRTGVSATLSSNLTTIVSVSARHQRQAGNAARSAGRGSV
jgi:gluconate 2-dehydrogenase alpha chain